MKFFFLLYDVRTPYYAVNGFLIKTDAIRNINISKVNMLNVYAVTIFHFIIMK